MLCCELNKFSECLAPLHKHEAPNVRLSSDESSEIVCKWN